ncbi:hypothetical protein PROPEN_03907 [Proteus penneri ATCC 35198]|nr:hypothetical protein PROPEN_03907 [Proteus penneri ATCC 35198]
MTILPLSKILSVIKNAIEHYQEELTRLSELDKQHTKALTDAKNDIIRLNDELRNHTKRVYIKADCPNPDNHTTATAGMGDATPHDLPKQLNKIIYVSSK